jgi:hypothetical protein
MSGAKGGTLPDHLAGYGGPSSVVGPALSKERWGGQRDGGCFIVPQNKDLKRLVRARMAETGERYTQALTHILSLTRLEALPVSWSLTGSRASDYEVGLLPETITHDGHRVVQLRLRPADREPDGFGALMQSIAATRYLGRRICFSAMVRAQEVTGWAGLWLCIDGPRGTIAIDNMQNRPLRQTTGWTQARIVLDVSDQATELHFGALLEGAGALDIAQPRFSEVGESVPVTALPHTAGPLPDEPQALDFGIAP